MKKGLKLSLIITIGIFLIFIPNEVLANQYGVTVAATAEESGSATIYIPSGTYHVYASIDADLGAYGSAICKSSIFSISTGSTYGTYIFESALTVNQSGDYIFTAIVNATTAFGYYANFGIVLTDLNVETLTKTSVIGNVPYAFEIVFVAIIAISYIYIQKRRNKQ